MWSLVVLLVIVGVGLYFLQDAPIHPTIKKLIFAVVILAALFFVLKALGVPAMVDRLGSPSGR
jgi:hypothetical protein